MKKKKEEKIKLAATVTLIVIGFCIAITIMLKYNIEGETNMPFELADIIIVSSAEGVEKSENIENYKWNLDIIQYNDIYIQISKNENYEKNTYIESITIENFEFSDPEIGNVRLYMPNSIGTSLFSYDESYLITRSLTYTGGDTDNTKTLEISAQGGNVIFRVANTNIGEYVSNDDDEISHNGTLINKTEATLEDLKISISFDILIETNISKYRGNISLDLPCGDILTEGTSQIEITDFSDVIFKREK